MTYKNLLTPEQVKAVCARLGITVKPPLKSSQVNTQARGKVQKPNRYLSQSRISSDGDVACI